MPFGNLNSTYRLGIANTYVANKFRWAREVLRLSIVTFPQPFPVYQGGIVHAANHWTYMFSRNAEQCLTSPGDSEHSLGHVMRQIVAYDTFFSRKNITPGGHNPPYVISTPQYNFSLNVHSSNRYGQMYFVQNEPESSHISQNIGDDEFALKTPLYRVTRETILIDPAVDTFNVIPFNNFWEVTSSNGARRAKAIALALVFCG
ncbi:MAG: hypothetical protein HC853_17490 [Anaerolineae bacterium]|nr:hypothetical protein [Anaerolineae bacterium]